MTLVDFSWCIKATHKGSSCFFCRFFDVEDLVDFPCITLDLGFSFDARYKDLIVLVPIVHATSQGYKYDISYPVFMCSTCFRMSWRILRACPAHSSVYDFLVYSSFLSSFTGLATQKAQRHDIIVIWTLECASNQQRDLMNERDCGRWQCVTTCLYLWIGRVNFYAHNKVKKW